jgi:hypothetical protein
MYVRFGKMRPGKVGQAREEYARGADLTTVFCDESKEIGKQEGLGLFGSRSIGCIRDSNFTGGTINRV